MDEAQFAEANGSVETEEVKGGEERKGEQLGEPSDALNDEHNSDGDGIWKKKVNMRERYSLIQSRYTRPMAEKARDSCTSIMTCLIICLCCLLTLS